MPLQLVHDSTKNAVCAISEGLRQEAATGCAISLGGHVAAEFAAFSSAEP